MGSEMCIRDRVEGDRRPVAGVLCHEHRLVADGLDDPSAVLGDDCLLYTSDAADERSSVDLGGRRIIKKKKNQDTTGLLI